MPLRDVRGVVSNASGRRAIESWRVRPTSCDMHAGEEATRDAEIRALPDRSDDPEFA